jgi:hypothetical protein
LPHTQFDDRTDRPIYDGDREMHGRLAHRGDHIATTSRLLKNSVAFGRWA